MKTVRAGALGAGAGFVAWFVLFWLIPDGFLGLGLRPLRFEDDGVVVQSLFGLLASAVCLFAFPIMGAKAATEVAQK